jgi:hypothetical protein
MSGRLADDASGKGMKKKEEKTMSSRLAVHRFAREGRHHHVPDGGCPKCAKICAKSADRCGELKTDMYRNSAAAAYLALLANFKRSKKRKTKNERNRKALR